MTGSSSNSSFWRSRTGLVFVGFAAIAGFYLLMDHTAHVFGALPFLLVLACPLLHLFHGGGHGAHEDRNATSDEEGGRTIE